MERPLAMENPFLHRHTWEQGAPEMILLHGSPQKMHPVEVIACDHGKNPHALQFTPTPQRRANDYIPPSIRPDEAWCTGCREYHHVSKFHKDSSRGRGLQYNCIEYRAARRTTAPRKKQGSDYWYRSR